MHVFKSWAARGLWTFLGAAGLVIASGQARAEHMGERLFMDNCAACHGEKGKGDGYMNEYLTTPAPNISDISAANDGVFPLVEVIAIIDGRKHVRTHGSNMPIWGSVFIKPLQGEISPDTAELAVKGRILALAEYLELLQQ